MCGIAGFISPRFNRQDLQVLTDSIRHRGPDADGYYYDEDAHLGLGHRRLSIIDLSAAANQPFYSHDGRYVMVYNGELYNYKEVQAKYKISPRTSSDSEIILEAFAMKGADCLKDFNGMFALAIWDKQEKKLFIVRDRFGKKPLVYYQKGDDLVFASELKAIMKMPVEKKINMDSLQDYFFLEYVPDAGCILENCKKLPKGHYMIYDNGRITISPYYLFTEKIIARPLPAKKEENALDELEEILASAVKYRQVSDVPLGAFLSGGTDSSLVCALFQKQNSNPINTFTIGFDVAAYDESVYASQVATILKTNHSETRLTDKSSMNLADNITEYFDEPFATPSTIPSYQVCQEARKRVKVAMSGDGGDELFMSYGHYDVFRKVKNLYRMDAGIGRHVISTVFSMMSERYKRGSRLFRLPAKDLLVHIWSEQQYMFSEKEIGSLLNLSTTNLSIKESWRKINGMPLSDYEKISLFDIEQYLGYNLMYKMDSASMANSLEVRNPYLDYRVMEYCYNLPEDLKVRNGTAKYLMKKLLERYLPKELVYRRKWGFPAPLGNWLSRDLSYLLDRWLDPQRIRSQGIFNEKQVAGYVKAFRSGKTWHEKRIWSMIFFQMWYSRYIEQHAD